MKNKFWYILLTLALLPLAACACWAEPQTGKPQLQRFVVVRTKHLVGPSEKMTTAQANCVINGLGDEATMLCHPFGITAKDYYDYNSSLVVDAQGMGYIIACRISLVTNLWCRSLSPGRVIRAAVNDGLMSVSEASGEKVHDYLILLSKPVGTVTTNQLAAPAPVSAPAPAPAPARAPAPASAQAPAPAAMPAPSTGNQGQLAVESLAGCSSATGACVAFVSDPQGADIFVDGKFVGNTPSTLTLTPGSHEIRMEAPQHAVWTRTLETSAGGRITVQGTLGAIQK